MCCLFHLINDPFPYDQRCPPRRPCDSTTPRHRRPWCESPVTGSIKMSVQPSYRVLGSLPSFPSFFSLLRDTCLSLAPITGTLICLQACWSLSESELPLEWPSESYSWWASCFVWKGECKPTSICVRLNRQARLRDPRLKEINTLCLRNDSSASSAWAGLVGGNQNWF